MGLYHKITQILGEIKNLKHIAETETWNSTLNSVSDNKNAKLLLYRVFLKIVPEPSGSGAYSGSGIIFWSIYLSQSYRKSGLTSQIIYLIHKITKSYYVII